MTEDEDSYVAAAERLRAAAATGMPCAPVRDLIAANDLAGAYAVQRLTLAKSGRPRLGRKIGLTSAAVQSQLGVSQPDFGTLLDGMLLPDGGEIPHGRLLQPKVEAEIAMTLAEDLDGSLPITAERARRAVGEIFAAVEVVDSRISDWDISIVDTIADNASSGMAVLGGSGRPLGDLDLRPLTMSLSRNGIVSSTGTGAACLGDPVEALAWLANTVGQLGDPLRAGELVLTGALGPLVAVDPGDVIDVEIAQLGCVSAVFGKDGGTR